jgi:hypothetical protein
MLETSSGHWEDGYFRHRSQRPYRAYEPGLEYRRADLNGRGAYAFYQSAPFRALVADGVEYNRIDIKRLFQTRRKIPATQPAAILVYKTCREMRYALGLQAAEDAGSAGFLSTTRNRQMPLSTPPRKPRLNPATGSWIVTFPSFIGPETFVEPRRFKPPRDASRSASLRATAWGGRHGHQVSLLSA